MVLLPADRAVELARDIMSHYGIDISHVTRHYDVTGKICPAPFVHILAAWVHFKNKLKERSVDISSLGITGVAATTVVCYMIGQIVKLTKPDAKWTP